MTYVQLDECEMQMAMAVGTWRHLRAQRERLQKGHGEPKGTDLARDLNGAIGELAFAKAIGIYWGGGANDFGKAGDVGRWEVRTTTHQNGQLIVYPTDPPARRLVLVVLGAGARARIAGYARAGDAPMLGQLPPPGTLRPGSPTQLWIPQGNLTVLEQHDRIGSGSAP